MQTIEQRLRAYPGVHADRLNLALHLVLVPLFQGGLVAVALGAALRDGRCALAGVAVAALAIALQGRGHAREKRRAQFDGPRDAIARIVIEQLVLFPCFVWSGGFARAWRRERCRE